MQLNTHLQSYFTSKKIVLNSFQEELIHKVDKTLGNTLIVAPTGLGKTLGASTIVLNDWLGRNRQLPRNQLQKQQKKRNNLKNIYSGLVP